MRHKYALNKWDIRVAILIHIILQYDCQIFRIDIIIYGLVEFIAAKKKKNYI